MSFESDIEELVITKLRDTFLHRHLTRNPHKFTPWKIHAKDELGGTHYVTDVGFYFTTHYCPSRDSYVEYSGIRTHECYLVVRKIGNSGQDIPVYYALDCL